MGIDVDFFFYIGEVSELNVVTKDGGKKTRMSLIKG